MIRYRGVSGEDYGRQRGKDEEDKNQAGHENGYSLGERLQKDVGQLK
jgi:hypothetical protein